MLLSSLWYCASLQVNHRMHYFIIKTGKWNNNFIIILKNRLLKVKECDFQEKLMLHSSSLCIADWAPKCTEVGLRITSFNIDIYVMMTVYRGSFYHLTPAFFTEEMVSCLHRIKSLCVNDMYKINLKLQNTITSEMFCISTKIDSKFVLSTLQNQLHLFNSNPVSPSEKLHE